MFRPLSWLFRRIARRYDGNAFYLRPEMQEILPPWWERLLRWVFGSPFRHGKPSETIFWQWIQRVVLLGLYLFFLWVLYESFWAWGIFE